MLAGMTDPATLRLTEPFPSATGRLRLRELTHDDAAFIMELVNDPEWLRFIGDRQVHSLEDARGYIDRVRDGGYMKHGFGLWVVALAADGQAAGLCGILKREQLEHTDVGFAFLERHRGRGLASESVVTTLLLAGVRYGLERVCAITDVDNVASQRVLRHAGFEYERQIWWETDGKPLHLYGRTLPRDAPRDAPFVPAPTHEPPSPPASGPGGPAAPTKGPPR
jgi:ribosomal-protein-alanine N-acetyltransferase